MSGRLVCWFLVILFACQSIGQSQAAPETWTVLLPPSHRGDEALRLAIEDLQSVGASLGIAVDLGEGTERPGGNLILVGSPETNPFIEEAESPLVGVADPEGYEIRTLHHGEHRTLLVNGGSINGDVYGLYWIWDRIRVFKRIPDIDVLREPAMKIRMEAAWGRSGQGGASKERMRDALRQSVNWVAGPALLDLVPWNSEPEAATNAANREKVRELIEYAHTLRLKYFSFANEFTFHPSLLEDLDATLSPCDPNFWDAVQEKFRMLLTAMPELDGIELCNDDLSGFWDAYGVYDLLHETPECEWSYTKRYRTFVKKVHEVVAEEFGKTFFQFTWSLTAHEQHSVPEVFREIFTKEIPTENLYLMPKITAGDRWWHQPYNRTFNQTPHETVVVFETMNYYESSRARLFPTFSGEYYQSGLRTFLQPPNSNVRGIGAIAGMRMDDWSTTGAYAYVLYRLQWDPHEDMQVIARDFCSIHFGPELAEEMAEIFLLSPNAYKYGLHIEPISYGQFNSFLHMRVGTFPEQGIPAIDRGREHLEFLERVYLRCKPWRVETLDDLDHGLAVARSMKERFAAVEGRFEDRELAREIGERLDMTIHLIRINNRSVRTAFALFDALDREDIERREALEEERRELAAARDAFTSAPGFGYELFGIDLLARIVDLALDDLDEVRRILHEAPTKEQIRETVSGQQARYREVLEKHVDEAVLFGRFEAQIDGNDILILSGTETEIHHMRWDYPHIETLEILRPLPDREITVVVKDLESRPLHPFVLEQPSAANDYTARIYFEDEPGGHGWVRCELYYLEKPPETLGLAIPWAGNAELRTPAGR